MTFSIKRAYGPLVVLACALSSSYTYSKALPDNKGKVSCSEDYRRDFSCECDFNNVPKVVDWMSELEAFTAGKELAECTLMYCISLGQGNSKEMRIYGGILRDIIERIGSYGPESNLKQIFIKGLVSVLEKENVHVFIKKARFAEWQKKFVMDAWEFALKELRVLAALDASGWQNYRRGMEKSMLPLLIKCMLPSCTNYQCGNN